jgi:hydrogenase maturation protein HypF
VSYEGQAAVELEWLAADVPPGEAYPWEIAADPDGDNALDADRSPAWIVDPRPLIRAVAADVTRGVPAAMVARRFHSAVVELIAEVCTRLRHATGLTQVVLSGGVFLNTLLTRETEARLSAEGFTVYRHRRVPAGDGGLSLGQLAVAAARLEAMPFPEPGLCL